MAAARLPVAAVGSCGCFCSRHALELLARAFELPVSYFAEYRLAELRRQLDEREVGFAAAYRTYQTINRGQPLRAS